MAGGLRFQDINALPETIQEQVVSKIVKKISENNPVAGYRKVKARKLLFSCKGDLERFFELKNACRAGALRDLRVLTEKGWVWGFTYLEIMKDGRTRPRVEEIYPMM